MHVPMTIINAFQVVYGLLLTCVTLDNSIYCILQQFDLYCILQELELQQVMGFPVYNEQDCPLLTLTKSGCQNKKPV